MDADTAARVRACWTGAGRRPVEFVDIWPAARVWLRTSLIEGIHESTEAQRDRDREFQYLRRKEERGDKRWDDEERRARAVR